MVGQRQRIYRRFEREAKVKNEEMRKVGITCSCGKCNLAKFNLQEIKEIIFFKEKVNKKESSE